MSEPPSGMRERSARLSKKVACRVEAENLEGVWAIRGCDSISGRTLNVAWPKLGGWRAPCGRKTGKMGVAPPALRSVGELKKVSKAWSIEIWKHKVLWDWPKPVTRGKRRADKERVGRCHTMTSSKDSSTDAEQKVRLDDLLPEQHGPA